MATNRDADKQAASSHPSGGHGAYQDGGWAWVVALGSSGTHFLVPAMVRSFGLVYLVMLDLFQESAAKTGLVVALFNTIRMMLGPFAGFLVDRFSCRSVVIGGGLLVSTGMVISAFATSLVYMFLSFSILTGIGASLVFTPSYIIVGQYFNKRKAKAMGIATMGSGLGCVAMAPLVAYLLKRYSFFGTMLILSAVQLNNCVFGALFRPPPEHRSVEVIGKVDESSENGEHVDSGKDHIDPVGEQNVCHEENGDLCGINLSKDELSSVVNDHINDDLDKRGLRQQMLSQFSIMTNRTFILYCLQIMAFSACESLYFTFLPGLANGRGVSAQQASFLLSMFGTGDIFGRFLCGVLLDLKTTRYRRRLFHSQLGFLMGTFAVLTALMSNYVTYAVMAVLFGLFEGGFHSQRATVVSEFVAKEQMSITVGFVIFFQGIGSLLGTPVGGAMLDNSGRYEDGYYFVGAAMMFTTLVFIFDYFWVLYRRPSVNKNIY